MTIAEAMNRIDTLKPNLYTQTEKIAWLSALDMKIYKEIVLTHENPVVDDFSGYNDDTLMKTELIAESPYDDMYVYWLESKIDYANAEITRYNNSITKFNEEYEAYFRYYNRTHMPNGVKFKSF